MKVRTANGEIRLTEIRDESVYETIVVPDPPWWRRSWNRLMSYWRRITRPTEE